MLIFLLVHASSLSCIELYDTLAWNCALLGILATTAIEFLADLPFVFASCFERRAFSPQPTDSTEARAASTAVRKPL